MLGRCQIGIFVSILVEMDDLLLDKLIVPSLSSSYTEVSKDEHISTHREQSSDYLVQVKNHLNLFPDVTLTQKQLAKLIAVLLQFSEKSDWSTEKHMTLSRNVIGSLCNILKHESLDQVLSLDEESVLCKLPVAVFQIFVDKVEKNSFELNPAACHTCNELILKTSGRKIASCLGMFLPFALNHLDHFLPANKIRGMKLLSHILDNITSSELLWSGLGDVLYETLHRLLYSNESQILEHLYPVLFLLLSKTTRNPANSETFSDWTKYDDVITLTLQHMRYEASRRKQKIFLSAIRESVEIVKFAICKHLTLIVHVLGEYCDVSMVLSSDSFCEVLEIFTKLVGLVPKQITHYVETIFQTVLAGISQHENDDGISATLDELLRIIFESDSNLNECLIALYENKELRNLAPMFHSSLKYIFSQ